MKDSFFLYKWPHLHRSYSVSVCTQSFIAVDTHNWKKKSFKVDSLLWIEILKECQKHDNYHWQKFQVTCSIFFLPLLKTKGSNSISCSIFVIQFNCPDQDDPDRYDCVNNYIHLMISLHSNCFLVKQVMDSSIFSLKTETKLLLIYNLKLWNILNKIHFQK